MAKTQTVGGRRVSRMSVGAVLVTTTFLASCGISDVPIYAKAPNFEVAERWAAYQQEHPGMVDNGWIHSFNDRRLVELVNEALVNNRDLRVASARLEEARARARRAGAPLLPTLDGFANTNISDNFDGDNQVDGGNLGLRASWEVDVWGRLTNAKAAAALDAVSESATFESARHSLAAAVADAWFVINGNAEILAVNRSELRVRREALNLVQERVEAGQVLSVDANIERANVATAESNVVAAEGALLESIRALEVLLGRYPDAELKTAGFVGGMPGSVPKGLPSELLERRPDIVAADRAVAAAFFNTESAKAARLPSFTISGNITGAGDSLGEALESGNLVWTLAGGVLAPIFRGNSLKEDVVIANAQQTQALESYASAALSAFQEVENAITNESVLARQGSLQNVVVEQRRQALDIEQQRYDAGEVEIDRVNDARLTFFNARRALVNIRVAQLRQRVALHLALGGSFENVATTIGTSVNET